MQDFSELKKQIAQIIQNSALNDKISAVYIFGSYAKNQQNEQSDLDLLVTLTQPTSGFDFLDLEYELEDKIKVKVDLVADDAISPYLKSEINYSKKLVYER